MYLRNTVAVIGLSQLLCYCSALVTLESINQLTNLTEEYTGHLQRPHLHGGGRSTALSNVVTLVDDEDEMEDVVAAVLKTIDNSLLEILNIPLKQQGNLELRSEDSLVMTDIECTKVTSDYHAFLSTTTMFLRQIEFKQEDYRWSSDSPVFDNLGYLQALWASRRTNEQNRSFIEQQLDLYRSTGCFDKINEQVLKRDVELVEYMNNLLDTFE